MKRKVFTLLFTMVMGLSLFSQEQEIAKDSIKYDMINFGLGIGQDYGGMGVNLAVYPEKHIGLFIGGGYAFAGFGYNAGVKIRFVSEKKYQPVNFFIIAMYGYNASIAVADAERFNKLFYGPTAGIGLDIGPRKPNKGYFSFSINVPFRSPDVNDYMDDLEKNHGVEFQSGLIPISFTLGYKFALEGMK